MSMRALMNSLVCSQALVKEALRISMMISNYHIALRLRSAKMRNFDYFFKKQVQICQFDNVSIIINYWQQSMNKQCQKNVQIQSHQSQEHKQADFKIFLQQVFNKEANEESQKQITIANLFECTQKANFIVAMSKFIAIFNIDVGQMECLKKLSEKDIKYIMDYNFESLLADTNRKQFVKTFQKSINISFSLAATFGRTSYSSVIIIIQNSYQQSQKYKVTFLNHQNLIHTVLNNSRVADSFAELQKLIDSKFKKINSTVCYNLMKQKPNQHALIQMLLRKFQDICYVSQDNINWDVSKHPSFKNVKGQAKEITVNQLQDIKIISTIHLNIVSKNKIYEFVQKFIKINEIIKRQIESSKISMTNFIQNQICVVLSGVYYNFISLNNLENAKNDQQLQQNFLSQIVNEKKSFLQQVIKKQEKCLNRKRGHYPQRLHKQSLICCVCKALPDRKKKSKSRYICQLCTYTYQRKIPLCMEHFRQYHRNIQKYIPKGVKKGAHKNQIKKFQQLNDKQEANKIEINQQQGNKAVNSNDQNILQKWEHQIYFKNQSLNIMASLIIQNHNMHSQASTYYQYNVPLGFQENFYLCKQKYQQPEQKIKEQQSD